MADKLTFSGNKTAKFYPACQAAYLHAISVRINICLLSGAGFFVFDCVNIRP